LEICKASKDLEALNRVQEVKMGMRHKEAHSIVVYLLISLEQESVKVSI